MSNSTISSSTSSPTSSSFTTSSFTSSSISSSSSSTESSTPPTSVTSIETISSVVTIPPTNPTESTSVVTVTSTAPVPPPASSNLAASSSRDAAAASSSAAALAAGNSKQDGGGLGEGGRIAIAVVVPIVGIALIAAGLIFFWKRRKARKNAEEERRKEVEEYGYNPNQDPTLPAVSSTYGETPSEMTEDNSGYRGWGATSTQRKPSTTLGSGKAIGNPGPDPSNHSGGWSGQPSEGNSGEPLVRSPSDERPGEHAETVGPMGAVPVGGTQNRDINRGPSNASSAYTGHRRSEGSDEGDHPGNGGYAPQYYEDVTYYNDAQPNHGPYGDGTYGGGQGGHPVIRDVQARRNTRIEKPSVMPQQGNAGIAQNF